MSEIISSGTVQQMAIWTFDTLNNIGSGTILPIKTENVRGIPTLQMFYQDIDDNGKAGIAYTDIAGVSHPAGSAAAWDDIRGSGTDAELLLTLDTRDWQDISLRFDYRSDSADSFDLEYSTDGGFNWTRAINNAPLVPGGSWNVANIDLTSITAIENQPFVQIRINDLDRNGNNQFRFDNLELRGIQTLNPFAPTIEVDTTTTTGFLNLTSTGAGFVSGVINDLTNPAKNLGINFTLADPDTPLNNLTVTATSNNPSVVPNTNLNLTGTGASRNLTITPIGVGYSDITVEVSDGSNTDAYIIRYAASAAGETTTRFHTGASDASTAIAIDNNYMLVADDEDQVIRLYDRQNSGLPIAEFDLTTRLNLDGQPQEVDIEGSTRVGNRIYWIGSHSNNSSGNDRPNRERIFSTDLSGTGASANLTYVGRYEFLETDLIAWDSSNGHGLGSNYLGLGASAAEGIIPEGVNGFNIEGLAMAPGSNTAAYVAFRAPLTDTNTREKALIVPVTNFTTIVDTNVGQGSASFGTPIELDLGGRGIRSIERNANNEYLIIAGPAGSGTPGQDFKFYTWTGNPADSPIERTTNLGALNTGGSFESIVELPASFDNTSQIQVLIDNGDIDWYGDGNAAKDLPQNNLQKFRSDILTLGEPVVTQPSGTISLSTPYFQDFNSLAVSGTNNPWIDGVTLEGWYSTRETYNASPGTSTTGALYSFGSTGNSDRALGSIASNATSSILYGARFYNDTDTTLSSLSISYTGEQWRNGGNTTQQKLDFAYQIDAPSLTGGTWIDFDPLDFVGPIASSSAGALDGNNSANRVQLSDTLTGFSLAPGQEIWLRWFDANDPGNDHGLAIDDLQVSSSALPGISIIETGGSTEVNEEGETTDTYQIALNTTPSSPVTIAIAANDGQTRLSQDGVNFFSSLTVTLTDTIPKIITVQAVDDDLVEGPHTGTITHTVTSTDPAYDNLAIPNLIANIIDNDVVLNITRIHEIQGTGPVANFLGETRTIEAIVVGDFQSFDANTDRNLRGFFVQEKDINADNNPLTSEGLFIFDDNFGVDVTEGDKVRVTGVVSEFTSGSSSLTQLNNVSDVTIIGSNNPLPTPAVINFPLSSPDELEAYEGMRVTIPSTLTVTEHFQLGRFGQVVLSSDGASNQPGTDGRLDQFTQFNAPSVSGFAAYQNELAKRRIVLDDGLTVQNPDPIIHGRDGQPLSATNTLRGGDTVTGLTGILDDRFGDANIGNYRIQPLAPADFQPTNPRPDEVPDVGGRLKVAAFNVLNYFNGDGMGGGFTSPEQRGAENQFEFERQRAKLFPAILGLNADVVGLIEIENDGFGPLSAIQDLVDGLNAIAGAGTYAFIDPGTPQVGTDAIAVGFIYKPASVTPVGVTAILDSSVDPRFDSSVQRPALAQSFMENATGEVFTAVNNHLKSKGSPTGKPGDEDQGDGQGNSNFSRTQAAIALGDWLATDPTGVNDPDYLVMGDLNAYAKEDPITGLEAAGFNNLVDNATYSFVFSGQWGALDHALATDSLTQQVTGAAKWHINADEPNVLDYNTNFKSANQIDSLFSPDQFRSSDHDPIIVGLNLQSSTQVPGEVITGTPGRDNLIGTDGDDTIIGSRGRDILTGGLGNDIFRYNALVEAGDIITDFEIGSDKLDLEGVLNSVGFDGSDPIAEGYITFSQVNGDTLLSIDPDGFAGSASPRSFVLLQGVDSALMNNPDHFIF